MLLTGLGLALAARDARGANPTARTESSPASTMDPADEDPGMIELLLKEALELVRSAGEKRPDAPGSTRATDAPSRR